MSIVKNRDIIYKYLILLIIVFSCLNVKARYFIKALQEWIFDSK